MAAVERFIQETTPLLVAADPSPNAWLQTALHEGVRRTPELPLPWS